MKKAFTLMEVNLAILIMAGGILSIVGLYSLGFRENRQGVEDVASAAFADAVISPLAMAISATNLKWSVFKDIPSYPSEYGWRDYFQNDGLVINNPQNTASSAFNGVMGKLSAAAKGTLDTSATSWKWDPQNYGDLRAAGLVVMHEEGSAIMRISFRASKQSGSLLSAPLYYTEVRFQGLANE